MRFSLRVRALVEGSSERAAEAARVAFDTFPHSTRRPGAESHGRSLDRLEENHFRTTFPGIFSAEAKRHVDAETANGINLANEN